MPFAYCFFFFLNIDRIINDCFCLKKYLIFFLQKKYTFPIFKVRYVNNKDYIGYTEYDNKLMFLNNIKIDKEKLRIEKLTVDNSQSIIKSENNFSSLSFWDILFLYFAANILYNLQSIFKYIQETLNKEILTYQEDNEDGFQLIDTGNHLFIENEREE